MWCRSYRLTSLDHRPCIKSERHTCMCQLNHPKHSESVAAESINLRNKYNWIWLVPGQQHCSNLHWYTLCKRPNDPESLPGTSLMYLAWKNRIPLLKSIFKKFQESCDLSWRKAKVESVNQGVILSYDINENISGLPYSGNNIPKHCSFLKHILCKCFRRQVTLCYADWKLWLIECLRKQVFQRRGGSVMSGIEQSICSSILSYNVLPLFLFITLIQTFYFSLPLSQVTDSQPVDREVGMWSDHPMYFWQWKYHLDKMTGHTWKTSTRLIV